MFYTRGSVLYKWAVLGVTRYVILLLLWYLSNITKYAIKIGNITQVTYKCNALPSNIVTVMNLILRNIITTSNEVTNLVSNSLSNAYSHNEVMKPTE